jgi:hypothetical protein
MRTIVAMTALAAVLAVSAVAGAAVPVAKKTFKGTTSEHAINGFKPAITFRTGAGGHSMRSFVFETLGCFGTGAFPVGVDPFVESPWRIASIAVGKTGAFNLAKVRATSTAPDAGSMTATVTGSFTSTTKVAGKITFNQSQDGANCGPQTVKFAATLGGR